MKTEELPYLRIAHWLPGTKDYDLVSIVEDESSMIWLANVPLRAARIIVACVNKCREGSYIQC